MCTSIISQQNNNYHTNPAKVTLLKIHAFCVKTKIQKTKYPLEGNSQQRHSGDDDISLQQKKKETQLRFSDIDDVHDTCPYWNCRFYNLLQNIQNSLAQDNFDHHRTDLNYLSYYVHHWGSSKDSRPGYDTFLLPFLLPCYRKCRFVHHYVHVNSGGKSYCWWKRRLDNDLGGCCTGCTHVANVFPFSIFFAPSKTLKSWRVGIHSWGSIDLNRSGTFCVCVCVLCISCFFISIELLSVCFTGWAFCFIFSRGEIEGKFVARCVELETTNELFLTFFSSCFLDNLLLVSLFLFRACRDLFKSRIFQMADIKCWRIWFFDDGRPLILWGTTGPTYTCAYSITSVTTRLLLQRTSLQSSCWSRIRDPPYETFTFSFHLLLKTIHNMVRDFRLGYLQMIDYC